jgi:hypothetical protein
MAPQHYARAVIWALESGYGSWEPALRILALIAGILLLLTAAMSIVRTMVIPRLTISFVYAIVLRTTDGLFTGAARLMRTYQQRDRILAWSGPVGIIAALIVWLLLFLIAYALLIFGVTEATLLNSLLQAGSGLLTLGLIGTPTDDVTAIDFVAAMTGPAVIALLIGFLPTLYQAYLGRESKVLLSTGFTGAPAWGPEALARTQLLDAEQDLPQTYAEWVTWCTQVRLSQTLYPALSRFRSPVASRNWLVSLVAVVDSAAMRIAIRSGPPDPRALEFISQASQTILSVSVTEVGIDSVVRLRRWRSRLDETLHAFGVAEQDGTAAPLRTNAAIGLSPGMAAVSKAITVDNLRARIGNSKVDSFRLEYSGLESSLPRQEFDKAIAYIRSAGVAVQRTDDEAFAVFIRLRGSYEAAAYRLAQRFYVPRAPWTGVRSPEIPVVYPTLAAAESEK